MFIFLKIVVFLFVFLLLAFVVPETFVGDLWKAGRRQGRFAYELIKSEVQIMNIVKTH